MDFSMCTAVTYQTKDFYFGRTLDYDFSYGDEITITPRNYPFHFRACPDPRLRYAMIGMAHVANGYPLYYEAVNEKGLGMAGLNFPGNGVFHPAKEGMDNIAQFELIPWILRQCGSVQEARVLLGNLNLWNVSFSETLPLASLHWLLSDREESVTIESVEEGFMVYDNPVGVLTNNPPFPQQLFALNNYMHLSPQDPKNTFAPGLSLETYCRGMGALGLPGDLSSQSRFVRACFVKLNSLSGDGESESVSQFFHILNSVDQQRGCCILGDGKYEMTIYTCCCNATKGIYYYTSYNNHQIWAVDMHREDLNGEELIRYSPITEEQIRIQN
jgi:penicillin V acylase-like amidase (Ntn superfamily)